MYHQRELFIFQMIGALRSIFKDKVDYILRMNGLTVNNIDVVARDNETFFNLQRFYLNQRRRIC